MRIAHFCRLALAISFVVGATACSGPKPKLEEWQQSPPGGITTGDLVFRKGHGFWTPHFINASTREKRFSHVGIVSAVENGKVSILHAEANEASGKGTIKEEDWTQFFAEALEGAVYRYDGDHETAKRFAKNGRTKIGVPFDTAFDLSDSKRLYCTEFVRNAINEAAGKELVGFSMISGRPFVTLDDIYARHFTKIWDSVASSK